MGDDIPAADIVAGDVLDIPVMFSGIKFDEDMLVIETGDLDTVVGAATVQNKTVREILQEQNLIPAKTGTTSSFENP